VPAYLFGIARRQVLKRLAAQGAALTDPDDVAESVPAHGDTPFDAMAREEAIAAVRSAIEQLPPIYREVVVLCELQEMNYADVAAVIECPIGTVRSRLHRARARLLATLAAARQVAVKRG
jgi:RNA polymerase sigma-70 factor (ECF subfamily)